MVFRVILRVLLRMMTMEGISFLWPSKERISDSQQVRPFSDGRVEMTRHFT